MAGVEQAVHPKARQPGRDQEQQDGPVRLPGEGLQGGVHAGGLPAPAQSDGRVPGVRLGPGQVQVVDEAPGHAPMDQVQRHRHDPKADGCHRSSPSTNAAFSPLDLPPPPRATRTAR